MRRPRIHEQIASADETTNKKKDRNSRPRPKGRCRRADRPTTLEPLDSAAPSWVFLRARSRARRPIDDEITTPMDSRRRGARAGWIREGRDARTTQIESVKAWLADATDAHQLGDVLGCLVSFPPPPRSISRAWRSRAAHPNCRNTYGEARCTTPFRQRRRKPAFVALLLGAGADERTPSGSTPLGARSVDSCVVSTKSAGGFQSATPAARAGAGVDRRPAPWTEEHGRS